LVWIETSVVLASVILTIPRSSVHKRLGHLDEATMQAVDACLRVSLAL
jgi:mRNA-degrading endonuclease toxin of MazEF toxin-antitoxin module